VEAMLHSWPLIVFSVIVPIALAFNSQGRQALQMTNEALDGFRGHHATFVVLGVLLITIYARLLTQRTALLSRPSIVRRYYAPAPRYIIRFRIAAHGAIWDRA
jgi:hypothetical protein